jgi:hypothetical protein
MTEKMTEKILKILKDLGGVLLNNHSKIPKKFQKKKF